MVIKVHSSLCKDNFCCTFFAVKPSNMTIFAKKYCIELSNSLTMPTVEFMVTYLKISISLEKYHAQLHL